MATVQTNSTNDEVDEWTKPPFLRRVRIRGYKSIAFCDVELKPLTILIGRNASGKSNFVDALVFLRDIVSVGLNEAIKRHGGRDAILCRHISDSHVRIEVEISFAISNDPDLWTGIYIVETELPTKNPAHIIYERLQLNDPTSKWWVGYTNNNGEVTCSAADGQAQWTWRIKDRPFLDTYHDTPVPEFSDYLTSMTAYNFYPEAMRRVQKPTPGLSLERDGSNVASVIETTKEMQAETISRVGAYLSAVVEGVESFWPVRYGEYETVRFRICSGIAQQPLEFDAASMSDGTLRALAALVAVFQCPSAPSLVCIEEPETALHPTAMRALVDALDEATGRTQILLTTHSADLLEDRDLNPSQILVVRNKNGRTQIAPVDPASREIIRKELYSLADLHRQDHLEPDAADLQRQAEAGTDEWGELRMPLRVAVIVEGHGEDGAIRPLLERIWYELLGGDRLDVLKPFRRSQGRLLQEAGLKTTVDATMIELTRRPPDAFQHLVLILIDSEGKCPKNLAPQLLAWGNDARTDADLACVLPHPMFETWFVAAASSLAGDRGFPADLTAPDDPEGNNLGKGWIRKKLSRKYSETADQPRFAAKINLALCRQNSNSFDKLCRELEKRVPAPLPPSSTGDDTATSNS